MRHPVLLASLCLAACTFWTPASAQKVYRCGNSYSQTPCAGGKTLDTTSAGSSIASKQAIDKENQRQVEAARALEKARLEQEAEAFQRHQTELKAMELAKTKALQQQTLPLKSKKPPEFFTAKPVAGKKP